MNIWLWDETCEAACQRETAPLPGITLIAELSAETARNEMIDEAVRSVLPREREPRMYYAWRILTYPAFADPTFVIHVRGEFRKLCAEAKRAV